MKPVAFDANAINTFQSERLESGTGLAHDRISSIFQNDCIALDHEGHCLQEWIDCAGGKFPFAITDWVDAQIAIGKIKMFEFCSNACRKHLHQIGLPKKDHKWVRLAVGCDGRTIVTDDVDFFDPTKKKADSKTKAKIKSKGGPCSKQLLKVYGIEVQPL